MYTTSQLQQVSEVDVLLVCHVLKTILTMHLGAGLVKFVVHRVVDKVSWKTGSLALVHLLLLHPRDEENLKYDHAPKDAPNGQDALESIDLETVSHKLTAADSKHGLTYCGANFELKM